MIDFKDFNENISDEMLAAYIDGNATPKESSLIEASIDTNGLLPETLDITNDVISFGDNYDWDIHKGDFGFWELGAPPLVTEADLEVAANSPEEILEMCEEEGVSIGELENISLLDDSFLKQDDSMEIDSEFDSSDIDDEGLDDLLDL